jgi:HAD superfamily hydrolase (TIGR01509 family)
VFDIDGTLVDSNTAHAEAWQQTLAAFGYDAPLAKVRRLIGKGGDKLVFELTGVAPGTPAFQEITAARSRLFQDAFLPRLKAFSGAKALLADLARRGLTLAVATSAQETESRSILRVAGLAGFFDAKTSADDAARSKPDPDIVSAALKRAGAAKNATLMIGDTPYDVEAARRAGVEIVGLRCGGWRDDDLEGALAVYDNPEALRSALSAHGTH